MTISISATHVWAYFGEWTERTIAWEIRALAQEGLAPRIVSFRPARCRVQEDALLEARVSFLDPFWKAKGATAAVLGTAAQTPAALFRPWAWAVGHNLAPRQGLAGAALYLRSAVRRAALAGMLQAEPPDLLHAQHAHVGWWLLPLSRRMGLPLAISVRGRDLMMLEGMAAGRWGEFGDARCLLLARSEEMAERLRSKGAPPDRVAVQPSGIPVEDIPFRERRQHAVGESPTIVSVGRLTPKKGMEDAIRAFAASEEASNSRAVLNIVGDGPLRDALEDLARQLGTIGRVRFLGRLAHADALAEMSRADVFLLASRSAEDGDREGVPNVIKEAAATGAPVVSTSHAGIPEAVRHGETGMLAPEGDVAALARALDDMLAHPERWADMGRKGRALVANAYDARTLARHLIQRYQALLGGGAA